MANQRGRSCNAVLQRGLKPSNPRADEWSRCWVQRRSCRYSDKRFLLLLLFSLFVHLRFPQIIFLLATGYGGTWALLLKFGGSCGSSGCRL